MNHKIKILSLLLAGVFSSSGALAVTQVWTDLDVPVSNAGNPSQGTLAKSIPAALKYRPLALNRDALLQQLEVNSSLSARAIDAKALLPVIQLPLPQGGMVKVSVKQASTMAPELAKKYPNIKTWRVTGVDDERITGVIDSTAEGFHAMLLMADGDSVFIDPDKVDSANNDRYLSFSKRSNAEHFQQNFQCETHTDNPLLGNNPTSLQQSPIKGSRLGKAALKHITYRLAVAATGEYTQYHGGSKRRALSAINTTVSRINELYQRDLGISFELVAQEDNIIYTDPRSDPYTDNNLDALVDQNVANLRLFHVMGNARFDIGHVFAARNTGGLANYGSVCDSDLKAGGASGTANPRGDTFALDFVSHEMGHQLGASHTYNSECGGARDPNLAVEPGSGSTIMSYAGLCSPNDLQDHVDGNFHAASIIQMVNFTRNSYGNQCGFIEASGNQNPEVSAGPDFTVPAATPFRLIASGTDNDGDTLSYTWEQSDTGTSTPVDQDTGDNPLIRSRPPNISKTRFIPRLSDLFKHTAVRGERLPVTDREMSFMATARDGKGGIDIDEMKLRISATGRSFAVTSFHNDQTLSAGDRINVTWDIAGTNLSPISCSQVEIGFVQADGKRSLLATTENDGEKSLTIPNNVASMDDARLLISCRNNLFFNVSQGRLKVRGGSYTPPDSSDGGGSMGMFLLPLALLGLWRRRIKSSSNHRKHQS